MLRLEWKEIKLCGFRHLDNGGGSGTVCQGGLKALFSLEIRISRAPRVGYFVWGTMCGSVVSPPLISPEVSPCLSTLSAVVRRGS